MDSITVSESAVDVIPANRNGNRKLPAAAEPYKFKPGKSGNPKGRPKGMVSKALCKHLRTKTGDKRELDAVVEAIVNTAKKGNAQAFCAIRDTVDGPPKTEASERGPAVLIQFIRDPQTPAIQVAVKPEI